MWAVYQYKGKETRFYTKAGIFLDPRIEATLIFIGYANTREEAVDLVWKGRHKPGPNG